MLHPDSAVMWPVRTLSPQEAVEFWNQKKAREDAHAREAEQRATELRAKVVRAQTRKTPRTTGGVDTK